MGGRGQNGWKLRGWGRSIHSLSWMTVKGLGEVPCVFIIDSAGYGKEFPRHWVNGRWGIVVVPQNRIEGSKLAEEGGKAVVIAIFTTMGDGLVVGLSATCSGELVVVMPVIAEQGTRSVSLGTC